jgi:hypothetical protein
MNCGFAYMCHLHHFQLFFYSCEVFWTDVVYVIPWIGSSCCDSVILQQKDCWLSWWWRRYTTADAKYPLSFSTKRVPEFKPLPVSYLERKMNEPFSFLIGLYCNCNWPSAEDEHDVLWFWLEKGKPHECPVCTQYFTVWFPVGIRSLHSKSKRLLSYKLPSLSAA